jgi:hypothetical protein
VESKAATRETLEELHRAVVQFLLDYWTEQHRLHPDTRMVRVTLRMLKDNGITAASGREVEQGLRTLLTAPFKRRKKR